MRTLSITVPLLVSLLAACGDGNHDGSPSTIDMAAPPTQVSVPATSGTLTLPFTASVEGAGTEAVGAVALAGGAGTIELNGRAMKAVIHERQAWPDFGYTLYQTIAASDSAWYVMWLYCQENHLVWVYYEGTDGTPMTVVEATGTCAPDDDTPATLTPGLPATTMDVGPLLSGITVTSDRLTLTSGAPGSYFTTDARALTALPFGFVDCTKDCGSPGWYEVHTILSEPSAHRASFTILYLFPQKPDGLSTHYGLTLPDLADLIHDQQWKGSWTVEAPSMRRTGPAAAPKVPWLWRPERPTAP